jgi:hypothetical protein
MSAVEDAHNARCTVGEDLSVTVIQTSVSPVELAARSQAQVFAADIHQRAAQSVGLDQEVGDNITGAAGDVGKWVGSCLLNDQDRLLLPREFLAAALG